MSAEKQGGLATLSRGGQEAGEKARIKFGDLSSGPVLPLCVLCDLGQVTVPL